MDDASTAQAPRSRILWAVLLLLGLSLAGWRLLTLPSEEPSPSVTEETLVETSAPARASEEIEPAEMPSETARVSELPVREEVLAGRPVREPVSACESCEHDLAIDRPTISELISERASELDDRVRLAMRRPDVSEGLRQGLLGALDPARQSDALAQIAASPDRVVDGFDHLTAVVSVLAWQALTAQDARRARELARYGERSGPHDPLPLLVDALASEALNDEAGAEQALVEAFRLEPREAAVSLAYLRRIRHGTDLDAAVAAGDAYLLDVPDDRQIGRMVARLRMRRSAMADGSLRRLRGLNILSPSSVDRAIVDRVLDLSDRALTESARLLGVPRRETLSVFVYRSHAELVAATCAQDWVAALYDGALHVDAERLASEREATLSVRHEALHASLHHAIETPLPGSRNVAVTLPTWFDEGLAQYFADEERWGARRSFELMVRENAFVPLSSMNGEFMVIDDPRDAGLAYHQALAMVLYMVDQRGERAIAAALQYLREGGDPDALMSAVGAPLDGATLLSFLRQRLATLPR